MKQIDIYKSEITNTKVCVALGYFDCVHIGHRQIIEYAKNRAKEQDAKLMIMTFVDIDFSSAIKDAKPLYSYDDRIEIFEDLGAELVLSLRWDSLTRQLKPQEFLKLLFDKFDIVNIVCGYDFRFGYKGKGDVELIDNFCIEKEANLDIISSVLYKGKRVSTTDIKYTLSKFDFFNASQMLGQNYFIRGRVINGRAVGGANGVPTANLCIDDRLFCLPLGVYGTKVIIKGVTYKAVTNIGSKPTYGIAFENIETLIVDWDGDLYGEIITIEFFKKIRDIVKFETIEELVSQINEDKNW